MNDNNNNNEQFKQIVIDGVTYPYLISSYGRVFSCNRGKYLTLSEDENRYSQVELWHSDKGKTKKIKVHLLVADAFIPNPDPEKLIEIDHRDGRKNNNHVSNLMRSTHKENITNSKGIPVVKMNLNYEYIMLFSSISEAVRYENLCDTTLRRAIDNVGKEYKGCYWKYADENDIIRAVNMCGVLDLQNMRRSTKYE